MCTIQTEEYGGYKNASNVKKAILPKILSRRTQHWKDVAIFCVGEGVEPEPSPVLAAGGSVRWRNQIGQQFLKKLEIHLPYGSAVRLLGCYLRERKMCAFTAGLVHKYPLGGKVIDKLAWRCKGGTGTWYKRGASQKHMLKEASCWRLHVVLAATCNFQKRKIGRDRKR